jgi:phage anti-repressor protein
MIETFETEIGQSVSATDLYDYLELTKSQYSRFIKKELIDSYYFEEGKDYSTRMSSNAKPGKKGQFRQEFNVHIDAAKKLCMVSRSAKGNEIRDELVLLTKKVETGAMLSIDQVNFLLELTPVMGLFSVQDTVQTNHYNYHNNKYDWWDYRAKVLGYGTEQLKLEVEKLNHKYKSQRQALIHVDKYELIRIGIIDLFISLGKSVEYASNVADLCKNMALKMKVHIWDDSEKKNSIPFNLGHNKAIESKIKNNQLSIL